MVKGTITIIFLIYSIQSVAQTPVVPDRLDFGGIKLRINEGARKEIQADVDDLTSSYKYFHPKVERAALYFPIIERILAEENVPDDFKYLVIQESALIPDAVSVSDAVGFWQFKDFTAEEMGLRVDNHVDERMNIISSTRAAARYIKKNNFYFDNWIYALQSYQMGAGGVLKSENDKYYGAGSMAITKSTYWYVKKYLAHRIAFEDAVSKQREKTDQHLLEYIRGASKSIEALSRELMLDTDVLASYNVWLKKGKIPSDKVYTVIVPSMGKSVLNNNDEAVVNNDAMTTATKGYAGIENPDAFPFVSTNKHLFQKKPVYVIVNGIPGVVAKSEMSVQEVSSNAEISEMKFRKYNEIFPHDELISGQVYYFKSKRNKAKVHYHTVKEGESLWEVSQKYGVKVSKLLKKNRLEDARDIEPGMVLWLRYFRPANEPVRFREIDVLKDPVVQEIDGTNKNKFAVENGVNNLEVEISELPAESDLSIAKDDSEGTKKTIYHYVKPKETLYSISKIYEVPVMTIANTNNIHISESIKAGQSLTIRVPEDFEPIENPRTMDKSLTNDEIKLMDFEFYQVKSGDTLFSISQKYQVTIDDIKKWNSRESDHLSLGETLKILKN